MYRRFLLPCFMIIISFLYTTHMYANTKPTEEIVLEDLSGTTIPLSSLKGKWIFINYWASWCGPCVEEIAEINRFYEKNKANNIAVFAVNFDAPLSKQQRLVRKFNINYPSLRRRSVESLHLGSIPAVPVTFVFNPEGKLTETLYGGQTLESLNEVIASSVKQKARVA